LEQPEIHLHPMIQSGLADVIITAAKHRDVQVIVESHSEHLLRRLQLRTAEGTLDPEDTALYFCDLVENKSILTALQVSRGGQIANWPKNFFGDEFAELASIERAALKRK
jgi:predicted ATPase